MSQVHSYLRILTGYGKTKSIGLSFLKSHPPAICWRSCNTMPRHYKKGATHEQHPKSPQIYIYILTHANAGWAYDRQSREIRERKWSKTRNRNYDRKRQYKLLLFQPRRRGNQDKRLWDCANKYACRFNDCNIWIHSQGRNKRHSQRDSNKRRLLYLPRRRLTPKEVAA